MSKGRFVFLGTGSSTGTPLIGCSCPVCLSDLPQNHRLRTSGLLQVDGKTLVIDVGPDFRQQAITHQLREVDGVILTHTHYDHIAGIDELRVYNFRLGGPMPCLLSSSSYEDIRRRYFYFFLPRRKEINTTATFDFQCLEGESGKTAFLDIPLRYVTFEHGTMAVNGFCFGNLAYVSDIKSYPETLFEELKGVDTLILSALRFEKTNLHFSIDEAVAFAMRVGAKETWLTHISHEVDHLAGNAYLPPGIRLAYDGLELSFTI